MMEDYQYSSSLREERKRTMRLAAALKEIIELAESNDADDRAAVAYEMELIAREALEGP